MYRLLTPRVQARLSAQFRLERSSSSDAGYSRRSGHRAQPARHFSHPARAKWLQCPVNAQQSCSVQTTGTPRARIQSQSIGAFR